MIAFIPFHPDHFREFEPAERNGREKQARVASWIGEIGASFTGLYEGRIVGCGGIIPVHEYRAVCWTSVSAEVPVARALRVLRAYLDLQTIPRLETPVDEDDAPCHRWVRALGFRPEGPVQPFFNADGSSAQVYVRYHHGA